MAPLYPSTRPQSSARLAKATKVGGNGGLVLEFPSLEDDHTRIRMQQTRLRVHQRYQKRPYQVF